MLVVLVWSLAVVVVLLVLGENPPVHTVPNVSTADSHCRLSLHAAARHLTSTALIDIAVWIATFVQRFVEHGELVKSCAERLEASQPKPGEPSPIPVGTVATYGPGLAPLEYARLTGLMSRYASAEGTTPDTAAISESQMERGVLSDVPAPWQDNDTAVMSDTAVSSPFIRNRTSADTTEEKEESMHSPPDVPAQAPIQLLSASKGVVYPRHLPELKVQKLPKCVM